LRAAALRVAEIAGADYATWMLQTSAAIVRGEAIILPAPVPVAAAYDPLSDPLSDPPATATPEALAGPTWPCASCGSVNLMERDTCAGCGAPFLSGLREQERPLLELPVVGDITRLGRGQRFALAGAVVLAFLVLTLLLGLVFG